MKIDQSSLADLCETCHIIGSATASQLAPKVLVAGRSTLVSRFRDLTYDDAEKDLPFDHPADKRIPNIDAWARRNLAESFWKGEAVNVNTGRVNVKHERSHLHREQPEREKYGTRRNGLNSRCDGCGRVGGVIRNVFSRVTV